MAGMEEVVEGIIAVVHVSDSEDQRIKLPLNLRVDLDLIRVLLQPLRDDSLQPNLKHSGIPINNPLILVLECRFGFAWAFTGV
jgi:hypothetical protein